MRNFIIIALTVVTVSTCSGIFETAQDIADTSPQISEYCEMNNIYIETGGAYGWPDFREIYANACTGAVK
jgi:heptaprenylglyceryl phosphate synthase